MKRRIYFGFTALLAAMLTFVGCEDFESDLAYYVEFGETTYEIVGINEDNSVKMKIETEVIAHTLVNETMNNSVIELDDEERHADVEHVSDSIYLLTATFDQVPLRKDVNLTTKVKGTYLNTEKTINLYIRGTSLVKVSDIQTLAVGPDSVSLQVSLKDYQYLASSEGLELSVVMERNGDKFDENTMRYFPSEIRDGKVQIGFVTHAPAGNYTLRVSNPVASTEAYSKSLQVNVPAPTATFTNLQYSIDEMGMHITGNVDRGNLLCNPYLVVGLGGESYVYNVVSTNNFHAKGLYPLYSTPTSVTVQSITKGGQYFGELKEFNVTSNFKRYIVDMGGDIYWSVYNEGVNKESIEGATYLRNIYHRDGYWRLPTWEEFGAIMQNTTVTKTSKKGVSGLKVKSGTTGNSLFFPNVKFYNGSKNVTGSGRYWLDDIYYGYSYTKYYWFTISSTITRNYDDWYSENKHMYYARYVRPKNPIRVTAISLSKSNLNMYVGRTFDLTATVFPENADVKELTYTSSNPEVATVSSTGTIFACKTGQCVITVSSSVENDVKATCLIQVEDAFVDLGLSVKWCVLNQGANENSDLGNSMHGNTAVSEYSVPTKEQYQELLDNCTQTKVYVNGVEGWRFTAPNGNSIFLPVTTSGYWTKSSDYYYNYSFSRYYGTVYYFSVNKATGPEILTATSTSYSSGSSAISAAWQNAYRYVREVKQ